VQSSLDKIVNYWSYALRLRELSFIKEEQIKQHCSLVPAEQAFNAQILDAKLIKQLQKQSALFAIGLQVFKSDNNLICPYYLIASIDKDGKLVPAPITLPIFARNLLEPFATTDFVLGHASDFDSYLDFKLPEWIMEKRKPLWSEQVKYASMVIDNLCKKLWRWHLDDYGYKFIENYSVIIPIDSINKETKFKSSKLIKAILDDNYLPPSMHTLLQEPKSGYSLQVAERKSGKSHQIAKLILNEWIKSAVNARSYPKCVWVRYTLSPTQLRYANFIDCVNPTELVLDPDLLNTIINNEPNLNFSTRECIENLLSHCSYHLKLDCVSIDAAMFELRKLMQQQLTSYTSGRNLFEAYTTMQQHIITKYKPYKGINARVAQLKQAANKANKELMHVQALGIVWERQLTLSKGCFTKLQKFPALRNIINKRLYKFFAQNLPNEDVTKLSRQELQANFNGLLQRLKKREDFVRDTLHQVQNEQIQLELVKTRLYTWYRDLNGPGVKNAVEDFVYEELFNKLKISSLLFFQLELLQGNVYGQGGGEHLSYYKPANFNFEQSKQLSIDTLFVEHANFIPLAQILPLINLSHKLIVYGEDKSIDLNQLATITDYTITKEFLLTEYETDYEDLQLNGIALATSSLWQLFAKKMLNSIQPIKTKIKAKKPTLKQIEVKGDKEAYMGSYINLAEIEALQELLTYMYDNDQLDLANTAIYTTFHAQRLVLHEHLKNSQFSIIPIFLLTDVNLKTYSCSIITTVYEGEDKANYVFDANSTILESLLENTKDNLYIVGEKSLFKKNRNVASSKFIQELA